MAKLIVTSKKQGVREYEIRDGDKISVGREISNDIVIGDVRVSRIHASFSCRGNKLFITDLFSRNGTIVNGELVVGDLELSDDDIINIGDTVISVEMSTPTSKQDVGEVTSTGGFSNTKIAAAQFRFDKPITDEQAKLLQNEIKSRNGHCIHKDLNYILAWWHGGSLNAMAKETVRSSVEILKTLRRSIPSLNVFIFALSALLEDEEPSWKINLLGDPIKICDEFNELLKAFQTAIVTERAISSRVSSEWKFNSIANIKFKKNFPSCELFELEYDLSETNH